jgi:hypothetical protein
VVVETAIGLVVMAGGAAQQASAALGLIGNG